MRVNPLRLYMNMGTLAQLPDWSKAPRGTEKEVCQALREAGFEGLQGGNPALCKELGMGYAGGGRVDKAGDAARLVEEGIKAGAVCTTLHVGNGFEDDAQAGSLIEDILRESERSRHPLYIETHRATITQDIWRTLQFVKRYPEVRFNGDFSHWYTGLEMVYGDLPKKLELMEPIFERTRFIHGRIGNPGAIQVDIGDGEGRTYVAHFRDMWTRCFRGFLRSADPGDAFIFAPELLFPSIYYAREFPDATGRMREEGDRWEQALLYGRIARDCFARAAS